MEELINGLMKHTHELYVISILQLVCLLCILAVCVKVYRTKR